ncbi:unnamed protein product [Pleuronectes platessa]|uniref:Up-regulator of cell proliferation-like domain-containing protein n=1 Tax=Pleuronectes platessa TaxID=8262 RepID=A0A9N7YGV6_PLEPL|nr:unnamed protein product [Pleuronectes platessa]
MSVKFPKRLSSKRRKPPTDNAQAELLHNLGLDVFWNAPLDLASMLDINTWNLENKAPLAFKDLPTGDDCAHGAVPVCCTPGPAKCRSRRSQPLPSMAFERCCEPFAGKKREAPRGEWMEVSCLGHCPMAWWRLDGIYRQETLPEMDSLSLSPSLTFVRYGKQALLIDISDTEKNEHSVVGFVGVNLEQDMGLPEGSVLQGEGLSEEELADRINVILKDLLPDKLKLVTLEAAADLAVELGLNVDEGTVCKKAMAKVEKVLEGLEEGSAQFREKQLPLQGPWWSKLAEMEKMESKQRKKENKMTPNFKTKRETSWLS